MLLDKQVIGREAVQPGQPVDLPTDGPIRRVMEQAVRP